MHYKNGREAKEGDKVLNIDTGYTGLLYNLNASLDSCNGRIAKFTFNDEYITVSRCLHLDDIVATLVADSSKL